MNDIMHMTFRCAEGKDLSAYRDNYKMFNILNAMDGRRSVSTIAREDQYELDHLIEMVSQLVREGALEPLYSDRGAIDKETIEFLEMELSQLVGPVARTLLARSASELGHDIHSLPAGMVNELLDMAAEYIQDKSKAEELKRKTLEKLI